MREDSKAFNELLELLKTAEQTFLTLRNQTADVDIADNYKHLFDLMSVAIDFYIHNDWARPRLFKIVSPWRKIGGDNAHALYDVAPLDGSRSYILKGHRRKTAYLGFTVYGGDTEEQITVHENRNSSTIEFSADGSFEIVFSAQEKDTRAKNHIRLKPDSNTFVVRQYFLDDKKEGDADLVIESLNNIGKPGLLSEADMAKRLRAMKNFIKGWTNLCPIPWPADDAAFNQVCPPFNTAQSTGHWSTPDNVHAFGFFKLKPDEALVLHGTSPDCLYWSCHLWNSCMQTFDYAHYACAIAKDQVKLEADGSWKLTVAHKDPNATNWLDTTGYEKGFVYFRWLNAAATPAAMKCEVVKI
jgi:hypothetical protein